MLKEDVTNEEENLLFGGNAIDIMDSKNLKNNLTPLPQNDNLKQEIEKLNKKKDLEIAGLKLKVKELEDKFHGVK